MDTLEELPRPTREAMEAVHRLLHRYEALTLREARDAAVLLLAGADLPDDARQRLVERLLGPATDEAAPDEGTTPETAAPSASAPAAGAAEGAAGGEDAG